MVISGGYNVYPKEVESEIDDLDGVNESAVIGVPHPDFGEAVVAVVVPKSGVTIEADKSFRHCNSDWQNSNAQNGFLC